MQIFYLLTTRKQKKIHNLKLLKLKHANLYSRYKNRISKLTQEILNKKSKIIFVTQIKHNGLNDEKLFLLNEILKEFSAKNSIDIIKLDEIYIGSKGDFYDKAHTTEQGSHKIAIIIQNKLKKFNKLRKVLLIINIFF